MDRGIYTASNWLPRLGLQRSSQVQQSRPVKITIGIQSLSGAGGTETYVLTVADHLQRAGHDVYVYTSGPGPWKTQFEAAGVRVATEPAQLPADSDVFLLQDLPTAFELFEAQPQVPQVYVLHSVVFDVQVPPQLPGITRLIVNLNEFSEWRTNTLAVKTPIVNLTQPIDTLLFKPRAPIGDRPRRAVAISNYLAGEQRERLISACEAAGIELRLFGNKEASKSLSPERDMNSADIVFGKARVIMEAMACGRAAYVYDAFGSDGWVTAENVDALQAKGFAGGATGHDASPETLAAEINEYSPKMGGINRDLATARYSATEHVSHLVRAIENAITDRVVVPSNDSTSELERLARGSWRHEMRAFNLGAELESMGQELAEERRRADESERRLREIVNSRRSRLASVLLRPIDSMRARSR